jgi:hypothetical protein
VSKEAPSPRPQAPASPTPATGVKRPAGARAARSKAARENPHAAHLKEHFERLQHGVTGLADPSDVYLGHEQGEGFWELLGFRLTGNSATVLGAVRFQRHDLPGHTHARESVGAYLTWPPTPAATDAHAPPPGHLAVLLPRFHNAPGAFLGRLREGKVPVPVHLATDTIEAAFDFRAQNPSALDSVKRRAGALRPHYLRTTAGHVIRGRSLGLGGSGQGPRFVAVTEAEQLTAHGAQPLPTVILNRSFIALAVQVEDEETRMAAPNWLPFLPASGNERHLLLG